jgi:FKBP-type peptidyl-prolyl cis-trans isomerase FklB
MESRNLRAIISSSTIQHILMKGLLAIVGVFVIFSCNAESQQVNSVKPTTSNDSTAYAIGMSIGLNIRQQKIDLVVEQLTAGLRDAIADKSLMTEEQMGEILQAFQTAQQEKAEAERAKSLTANTERGQKFLEENKKKKGVVTTASGLQYEVLKQGTGPKPTKESKVKVHYTGTLIDGKVFDSSVQRGQPIDFPLNGVIAGWTEGVQLMNVGSKFKFYIPSQLAYGERGAGQDIGPNETLIFEVELLEILK